MIFLPLHSPKTILQYAQHEKQKQIFKQDIHRLTKPLTYLCNGQAEVYVNDNKQKQRIIIISLHSVSPRKQVYALCRRIDWVLATRRFPVSSEPTNGQHVQLNEALGRRLCTLYKLVESYVVTHRGLFKLLK